MTRHPALTAAVAGVALLALGCSIAAGAGAPKIEKDPAGSAPAAAEVLLSDDFASGDQWGTGTDAESSVEYRNGALNFVVFRTDYITWSTPNKTDYQSVHMEATVHNNKTDSTTAFGFICDKEPSTTNFYYLAITPAGQYVIARSANGKVDVFLTNNDKWGDSKLIPKNADSYELAADCSDDGTLALYVNGQQIDSATDTTYSSGAVGLMAWSGTKAKKTDVSFDDFVMTQLPRAGT
jgi:hypothetical protein